MVTMSCRQERGYIYIWMLFAVMLAGVMLAAAGLIWQTEVKREKELELLFAGDQFRRAIESYYNDSQVSGRAGEAGASRYPASLEQLLKDERSLVVKRHLRRIYPDPMTNSYNWGLVRQQDGGITGVYSLSTGVPIKRANFPADYIAFEKAGNYQGWKFVHAASTAGGQEKQQAEGRGNMQGDMPGLPGTGFNPLPQNQPAPNLSPPTGNDAF
ncbi:MAG: type II secretion system protein [Nitrosomonas sp.]|nr:type II secretion system protein [Nitrosomonas sp.]